MGLSYPCTFDLLPCEGLGFEVFNVQGKLLISGFRLRLLLLLGLHCLRKRGTVQREKKARECVSSACYTCFGWMPICLYRMVVTCERETRRARKEKSMKQELMWHAIGNHEFYIWQTFVVSFVTVLAIYQVTITLFDNTNSYAYPIYSETELELSLNFKI